MTSNIVIEKEKFFIIAKDTIKKSLKWYSYPLIYFLVTGLVCAYAWYSRPIPHRAGIKIVFKTISVIPTLIGIGATTVWIAAIVLIVGIAYWLQKRFPQLAIWNKAESVSLQGAYSDIKAHASLWRKIANASLSVLGILLIVAGLSLAIWISRPYITLLLSTSKIKALENKVKLGRVQGNRIIIPTALVDVPILEGVSIGQLSQGVCHISQSPSPGEGGNCIIEGHNLAEFGWWRPQSFFSMLEILDKGTPIYIFYNGRKYVYKVKEQAYKNVNDPKLYDITLGERLTLITCVSTWSPTIYTNRRTVIVAYPQEIRKIPAPPKGRRASKPE
ncbi:MAG: sortase [Thermodesulfovibrionales bacterium]|nr:sortase [Thermodesulfovibrionales bacterium]